MNQDYEIRLDRLVNLNERPNMQTWQLQEAKTHFSKLIKNASLEGPQLITLHGETTAIVLSKKDYEKLAQPKPSFVEFIRTSPLLNTSLDIKRNKSPNRNIKL